MYLNVTTTTDSSPTEYLFYDIVEGSNDEVFIKVWMTDLGSSTSNFYVSFSPTENFYINLFLEGVSIDNYGDGSPVNPYYIDIENLDLNTEYVLNCDSSWSGPKGPEGIDISITFTTVEDSDSSRKIVIKAINGNINFNTNGKLFFMSDPSDTARFIVDSQPTTLEISGYDVYPAIPTNHTYEVSISINEDEPLIFGPSDIAYDIETISIPTSSIVNLTINYIYEDNGMDCSVQFRKSAVIELNEVDLFNLYGEIPTTCNGLSDEFLFENISLNIGENNTLFIAPPYGMYPR